MKILVIDDESDVVRYLSMVLGDHGCEILAAQSAEEAEEWLKRSKPDLICLDIMMPKESGMNFYAKLKSNSETKSIPVFIVSAVEREREFDIGHYISDNKTAPPEKYFEKPIEVKRFLEAVDQIQKTNRADSDE